MFCIFSIFAYTTNDWCLAIDEKKISESDLIPLLENSFRFTLANNAVIQHIQPASIRLIAKKQKMIYTTVQRVTLLAIWQNILLNFET